MSARKSTAYLLVLPGLAWLAVFFIVPTITLVSQSLQEGSLETGYVMTWNFGIYADVFQDYAPTMLRSLVYAGLATLAALIIAYPLAYTIAFKAGRWRNVLLILVVAPFFTSFLVRTLAWKIILADEGWVADVLRAVGLLSFTDDRLLATPIAVVCGLTYNFLPFMTLPLYTSLERLDGRLLEAATDLYASPFTTFRKVTFPLSLPGVVGGTLLTFIPAAGDYVNAEFLGTPQTWMIGNVVQQKFLVSLDYPGAAALSVILMVVIISMVLVYVRRAGTEELV
ncbi:ABC transporter permease [Cryptosporangium aurantiacum]|uniref:Spermidine/putrescine transport system permease protein n=1 Tax=Cryptosporangium aurantiacum TaxID=134849 RepID=A0A1M7HZU1_9ACTN|nr:ABC transporter permease [Cryptosporangium aurantiacum]SHM33909.1 spermidine/putrescine transport system permease protein [Cryptosporangium aurantiacum]